MAVEVILNPYAGRWNAKKRIPEVEAAFHDAGIDYHLSLTDGPQHAIRLAYQAVQNGAEAVFAAGGDGTISEVVNGMAQASIKTESDSINVPLGVLALGSANDFVVNMGLHKDVKMAAASLKAGKTRRIDLGQVSFPPADKNKLVSTCYFDNNSAVGLEPSITLIQQKITFLHGTLRYLFATLIGIIQHAEWDTHLEWDGGSYDGPTTLVTVGNNPLTGGLFYMTPHADPADGRLTFVYGFMRTRLQTLRLLPRTMKKGEGSYVEHPDIHEVHSSWLKIRTAQPTPLHADGEIQAGSVHEIEYTICPKKLPILVPA